VACRRIPLDFAVGEDLAAQVAAFCAAQSPRRAPALFASVKSLYADSQVGAMFEQAMQARLLSCSDAERPWIHHFLAKHHDFMGGRAEVRLLAAAAAAAVDGRPRARAMDRDRLMRRLF
jgi:hypothetical protein